MNMIRLVISNSFYEQLTKTVRRQPELYTFEKKYFLSVYGHIHMFHALKENYVPVNKNTRRQRLGFFQ